MVFWIKNAHDPRWKEAFCLDGRQKIIVNRIFAVAFATSRHF